MVLVPPGYDRILGLKYKALLTLGFLSLETSQLSVLSGSRAAMMLMGISVPFREVSLLRKPLGLEHVIWREVSLLVSTEKAMRRPQAMKWATIGFTLFVFLIFWQEATGVMLYYACENL